jgi:hypothetical protein
MNEQNEQNKQIEPYEQNEQNKIRFNKGVYESYIDKNDKFIIFERTSRFISFGLKEGRAKNYGQPLYILLPHVCVVDYDCKSEESSKITAKKIVELKDKYKERSDIYKNPWIVSTDVTQLLDISNLKGKMSDFEIQELYEVCIILCKKKLQTKLNREMRINTQHRLNMFRNLMLSLRLENMSWTSSNDEGVTLLHRELTGDNVVVSYICDEENTERFSNHEVGGKIEDISDDVEEIEEIEIDDEELKVACKSAILELNYDNSSKTITREMLQLIERKAALESGVLDEYSSYIKKIVNEEFKKIKREADKLNKVTESREVRSSHITFKKKKKTCTIKNPSPDGSGNCPSEKSVIVIKDNVACCYKKGPKNKKINVENTEETKVGDEIEGVEETKVGDEIEGVEETKVGDEIEGVEEAKVGDEIEGVEEAKAESGEPNIGGGGKIKSKTSFAESNLGEVTEVGRKGNAELEEPKLNGDTEGGGGSEINTFSNTKAPVRSILTTGSSNRTRKNKTVQNITWVLPKSAYDDYDDILKSV